jgi:hypothetical protein
VYCQHCGNPIADAAEAEEHAAEEAAAAAETVAEEVSSAEVRIAEIQADRDITLAKIERGIIGQELEAAATEDAVKADILDQAMEQPEPEAVPVEVVEPPADEAPSEEPPPVIDAEPEPAAKGRSNPWW